MVGAALGAIAAVASRPDVGRAADGDAVKAGQTVTETLPAVVDNTNGFTAIWGTSSKTTGSGVGVHGETAASSGSGVYALATKGTGTSRGILGEARSPSGVGVYGLNATPQPLPGSLGQTAVMGYADAISGRVTGVYGLAPAALAIGVAGVSAPVGSTIPATTGQTGVFGFAHVSSGDSAGVSGIASGPSSIGVHGVGEVQGMFGESGATGGEGVSGRAIHGTGVHGFSATKTGGLFVSVVGNGLEVVGKVSLNRSGIVTIPSGSRTLLVDPGPNPEFGMSDNTKVMVTLQSNPGAGVFLKHVTRDTFADTFTIVLNKAATADTTVAWLMLD
jgi:hypothetical protein